MGQFWFNMEEGSPVRAENYTHNKNGRTQKYKILHAKRLLFFSKISKRRPTISSPHQANPVFLKGRKWRHVIVTMSSLDEPPLPPQRRKRNFRSQEGRAMRSPPPKTSPNQSDDDAVLKCQKVFQALNRMGLAAYLRVLKASLFQSERLVLLRMVKPAGREPTSSAQKFESTADTITSPLNRCYCHMPCAQHFPLPQTGFKVARRMARVRKRIAVTSQKNGGFHVGTAATAAPTATAAAAAVATANAAAITSAASVAARSSAAAAGAISVATTIAAAAATTPTVMSAVTGTSAAAAATATAARLTAVSTFPSSTCVPSATATAATNAAAAAAASSTIAAAAAAAATDQSKPVTAASRFWRKLKGWLGGDRRRMRVGLMLQDLVKKANAINRPRFKHKSSQDQTNTANGIRPVRFSLPVIDLQNSSATFDFVAPPKDELDDGSDCSISDSLSQFSCSL